MKRQGVNQNMGRKYAKPPVIEAVCEFRLPPSTQWDLTIPGLVYERVREEFPHKEQRVIQNIEVTEKPDAGGIQHKITAENRAWFLTEDRNTFIQVGTRALAVNRLSPYPTWEEFRPAIEKAVSVLREVVEVSGFQRIGLRYINRIEIPSPSVELDDYFAFRLVLGEGLPQLMQGFICGAVLPFLNGRDLCKVELTNAVPESQLSTAFLLDLDYYLARPEDVSAEGVLAWVEEAHRAVEDAFEDCISDRLRELFEEMV